MCQALDPQGVSIDIRFPDFGKKEKKVENMSCLIVNFMATSGMNASQDSFNSSQ